jgi:hypothetical protein
MAGHNIKGRIGFWLYETLEGLLKERVAELLNGYRPSTIASLTG